MNNAIHQTCACPCGESTFEVNAKPIARFTCHCEICQSLYKKPSANFTVVLAKDVKMLQADSIQFKKYRLPPALRRGVCSFCNRPVIGFLRIAPFLKLAFIASSRYPEQDALPANQGHIFYHRRVADVNDSLPKFEGYLSSEWAVTKAIMSGLFR